MGGSWARWLFAILPAKSLKHGCSNISPSSTSSPKGSKLPQKHGPWHATGVIRPDKQPPHNFSRSAIEKAINEQGFQLWRVKPKEKVA